MKAHCTRTVSHSTVKVEENKRKALFNNPSGKSYCVTKVDDCLVTEGPRADYLVVEGSAHSVLVELKGKNVAHACEQLFASARHEDVAPLLTASLGFLVVCSRFPRVDTAVLKAKTKAAKEYGAGFHVVCDKGSFDIERIASIRRK